MSRSGRHGIVAGERQGRGPAACVALSRKGTGVAANDLIDTTEMYLKTIYELDEDGIVPLRARIVDRLGHSGPTVSQTVARMERDGLVTVMQDRRLELTEEGRRRAREVMRKHRLAERLLVDVIGMDWAEAHEEACRWEHVMSTGVEDRLSTLLEDPHFDPYGNPIPGYEGEWPREKSLEDVLEGAGALGGAGARGDARGGGARGGTEAHVDGGDPGDAGAVTVVLGRIGEPIQAWPGALEELDRLQIRPGVSLDVTEGPTSFSVVPSHMAGEQTPVQLPRALAAHFFVLE